MYNPGYLTSADGFNYVTYLEFLYIQGLVDF